jgi:hypothetical protein
MRIIILRLLTISCIIVGLSAIASASPAIRLLDRDAVPQISNIEPVYYYWNHHRYRHRSWDKYHKRWRYY